MRWHRGMLQAAGIATVGEAYRLGWTAMARCATGRRQAMRTHRECGERSNLDMETLIWSRGANFRLAELESHLKCPHCGSRNVSLIFRAPPLAIRAHAGAQHS
jgi:hypothetical protein